MISSLAQEIEKWIAEHQGALPSSMHVPAAIVNEIIIETNEFGIRDAKFKEGRFYIRGIPVLADSILTIGKIDP